MTSTTQVRPDLLTKPEILTIPARDGIRLAAALYRPAGPGPFPVLFAASPYRFDNNTLPASAQFLYRETGPIAFYVERGYAYVHLDIRGCGRSEGEFDFLGPKDQADLYDAIEFVGTQSWSSGKVGGLGQSYYCMLQWWMGIMNPPSLNASARTTVSSISTAPAAITAASSATSSATGGSRTASSISIRPMASSRAGRTSTWTR